MPCQRGAGSGEQPELPQGALALRAASIEVATYPFWRTWCLRWGATDDEAARAMPGDDLLANPDFLITRAVTVAAPPSAFGHGSCRSAQAAGALTPMTGSRTSSGSACTAQTRSCRSIRISGSATHSGSALVGQRSARPSSSLSGRMVLRSEDGNWVWAFQLVPSATSTRLISRNRIATPGATWSLRALYTYLMEPGSLVMERKMLLGIKDRAERIDSG